MKIKILSLLDSPSRDEFEYQFRRLNKLCTVGGVEPEIGFSATIGQHGGFFTTSPSVIGAVLGEQSE